MPADVRAKLNGDLNKALKNPELAKAFENYGLTPRGTGPEDSAKILKSEYDKWKKIIVDGNIKLEN